MKKISLFLSLLLAFAGAVKAQNSQESKEPNVVLVKDAAEELTNGTVIALQCRDYNGGGGYFFVGKEAKTADFSADNLFVVEGSAAEGMKLRRLTDDKYIGKNGNTVTEVDETNAVTFTAKSYKDGKNGITFNADKNAELDGTEESLYVRFIVTEGQSMTFLNTRELGKKPNYASGIGGFSAWYVYKFSECSTTFSEISLSFERKGTTAKDVTVSVGVFGFSEDENDSERTAEAEFGLKTTNNDPSNSLFNTAGFPSNILCPNATIGTVHDASLTFTLTGLPSGFSFNKALLEIHSLSSGGGYQVSQRWCDLTLSYGEGESKTQWAALENQNITNQGGKWWTLTGDKPVTADSEGHLVLTLDLKKGSSSGNPFYVGLSGIRLIGNISPETITEMKTADVQDLLDGIKFGYKKIGYEFPVLAKGVTAEDVAWPQALDEVFSGLNSKFELLDYAKSAIESGNNLTEAKEKLAEFVRVSKLNKGDYPVSVAYKAAARYGTLYTPFNITNQWPADLKIWECTELNGNALNLTGDDNNSIAANTAYIVEVTNPEANEMTVQFIDFSGSLSNEQANSTSLLVGTHTGTTAPENSYVLQNQDGEQGHGLGFYLVDGSTQITVPAGKCYLMLPEPEGEDENGTEAVKYLRFPDGTLTAIDSIDAAKPADAATYDLSGRRVGTMTKGLYIVGGKKVIVK